MSLSRSDTAPTLSPAVVRAVLAYQETLVEAEGASLLPFRETMRLINRKSSALEWLQKALLAEAPLRARVRRGK